LPTSHWGSARWYGGRGPTHSVTDGRDVGKRPGTKDGSEPTVDEMTSLGSLGESEGGADGVDRTGDGDVDSSGVVGATATFATPG